MIKLLKLFFNWIIYSNIFVAFCVLALTLSSELLLNSTNIQISQFVFFATLFTYNLQRIIKRKIKNHYPGKNKSSTYFIMFISGIISVYHFYYFQVNTQIIIIAGGIISILYPFGLRRIPYGKIFIISLIWVISTMVLIIVENEIAITLNVNLHLLTRFLFVFAITIPFDIRDLKYDKNSIKTIPIMFGEKKSKWIAVLALFIAQVISVIQVFYCNVTVHIMSFISLFLLATLLIINSSEKKKTIYYSFWVESLSVFYYVFLTLSTLLI